jgi:hypothetical protein
MRDSKTEIPNPKLKSRVLRSSGMKKIYLCAIVLLTTVGFMGLAEAAHPKSTDSLTGKQVKVMVEHAKTPADHTALANHFNGLAARYETDASNHTDLAEAYRKNPNGRAESKGSGGPDTASHCDRFAELSREAAKEARAIASAHEHMASEASK